MGDSHMGLHARLMSQALRKLTANIKRSNTLVIFINQIRMKIGVMFGNPETTSGGRALKFYSSVRIDIRRIESLKDGGENVGNRCRVKIVKNKMAPPFRQAEFDIMFGEGISREGSLLDVAVDHGVVRKSGAWFTFDKDQLGQGRENAKQFLEDHPDLAEALEDKLREELGLRPAADLPPSSATKRCCALPARRSACTSRPSNRVFSGSSASAFTSASRAAAISPTTRDARALFKR